MDRAPTPPPRLGPTPALLLATVAALAGINGLKGELLYDDLPYVVENPQVQDGGLAEAFGEPFAGRAELGLYRPLAVLSYQWQAGGEGTEVSPVPLHLFNLALHASVTLLVALLGLRLGFRRGSALIGAALFAVHPCHVEAVTWIVGRAELIAAAFGIAFLLVALRPASLARDLSAATLWLLACLGKEGALALPAVLVIADLAGGHEARRGALRRYALLAAVFALLVWTRWSVLGRFAPDVGMASFGGLDWWERVPVCANLAGAYVAKILWPWPDRIFYHYSEFLGLRWTAALPVVAATLLWFAVRRSRRHWLLAGAFFIALFPVLNLKPIQETFALRFLYLPSAFACLLLGDGVAAVVRREIRRRGRAGASLALPGALIVGGLALSWSANSHWHDPMRLWLHNLSVAPRVEVDDHPGVPPQFPYRDQGFPFHHYQTGFFSQEENILLPRDARRQGAKYHYQYALHVSDQLEARGLKGMPHEQRARAELNLGRIYSRLLPRGQQNPPLAEAHLRRAVELGLQWDHLDWELAAGWLELALLRGRRPSIDHAAARRWLHDALDVPNLTEELRESVEQEIRRIDRELKANDRSAEPEAEAQRHPTGEEDGASDGP